MTSPNDMPDNVELELRQKVGFCLSRLQERTIRSHPPLIIFEEDEEELEKAIEGVYKLIEAEAARARIDELERINPTTEWTLSASARQSTIGERLAELKIKARDAAALETTQIMGKSIDEVITILRALDIERVTDIKVTMSNLDKLYVKLRDDVQQSFQKSIDATIARLSTPTDHKEKAENE